MDNAGMAQTAFDPRSVNGGYGRPTPGAVGGTTPLDDLSKSLDVARDRIASAIQRTKAIADSLIGAEPEGKPSGPDHPPRIGRMGSLNDQVEYLHAGIGELERQISRIGTIG